MTTDTKRLRSLERSHVSLSDELRSLILAACEELERLRDACVSTGWLDSETPLSMSNHVVQMYGEACVAQDNAAKLRAENERLRQSHQWRPMSEAPRDGTEVALEVAIKEEHERARTMMVGRWVDGFWREMTHNEERCFYDASFARWLPLPPIPTKEADHD